MWFEQHGYQFVALTMTLFSSIACLFPDCLDDNTVTITRDWKVFTNEEYSSYLRFELITMSLGKISDIMEEVGLYKAISDETELEKPNERFVQDMM